MSSNDTNHQRKRNEIQKKLPKFFEGLLSVTRKTCEKTMKEHPNQRCIFITFESTDLLLKQLREEVLHPKGFLGITLDQAKKYYPDQKYVFEKCKPEDMAIMIVSFCNFEADQNKSPNDLVSNSKTFEVFGCLWIEQQ